MTREELVKMTGSEEQADYALSILLKHIKPAFIRSAIHAELQSIETEIQELRDKGIVYSCNGYDHVSWGHADKLNGLFLTPEQQAAYDAAYAECQQADRIIYTRNRTASLTAYRG